MASVRGHGQRLAFLSIPLMPEQAKGRSRPRERFLLSPWFTMSRLSRYAAASSQARRRTLISSGVGVPGGAGLALSAAFGSAEALTRWIHRFTELLATKR